MRIVLMKIRRTKGRFLLFFFAVFFSMVMWLLTCLLYAQSANSRQYIEASTTTLALQDSGLVMEEIPGGGAYYRMEEPDAEKISQARASAAVKNNHRSTTFSGIGQGLTIAMPTEMSDRSHTTGRYFIAENTAAFTVKIESIVDVSPFGTPKYVDGTWIQAERAYYQILADVLEVHAFSGHPVPENITLMGDWVNEDGSIPFKPGESWVVIGTYQPAAPGWSSMSGKLEYVEPKPYANCLR